MKNVNINCFKNSISFVMKTFTNQPISFKKISTLERKEYVFNNIIVAISFCGDYYGNVYLSMNELVAHNITSAMLGGIEVTETDEITKSAIGELCNMIMGTISKSLSDYNIKMDFSTPTVISDEPGTINNMLVLNIPIKCNEFGTLNFDLEIK